MDEQQTATSSPQPLPCPFCGGEAYISADRTFAAAVECANAGCEVAVITTAYGQAEAIEAWNSRASDSEIERLRGALKEIADADDVSGYSEWVIRIAREALKGGSNGK